MSILDPANPTEPQDDQEEPQPRRPELPALRLFLVRRMDPRMNQDETKEGWDGIEEIPLEAHTLSFDEGTLSFGVYSYAGRSPVGRVTRAFAAGEWLDVEEVIMPEASSSLIH